MKLKGQLALMQKKESHKVWSLQLCAKFSHFYFQYNIRLSDNDKVHFLVTSSISQSRLHLSFLPSWSSGHFAQKVSYYFATPVLPLCSGDLQGWVQERGTVDHKLWSWWLTLASNPPLEYLDRHFLQDQYWDDKL